MRRLLIRPGAIGDCILSFPALRHLKADYTEVWCSGAVVPLVHFADSVRSIASTGIDLFGIGDLRLSAELKTRLISFDSIVSWYGANRPEFRSAMEQLRVPCTFHHALPPAEYDGAASGFYNEQTGTETGLLPRIIVEPSDRRDSVVIQPFSGSRRKNWPLASFQKLAPLLKLPVEWTAGPEEPLDDAVRFENLNELARWMKGARVYVGNDSGITHLAAAIGMPTVAIFGPRSTRAWMPRGANVQVLQTDCLDSLTADVVANCVNGLLNDEISEPGERWINHN